MNCKNPAVWEDLIQDFLELRSALKKAERLFLIQELKNRKVDANRIVPASGFSIAKTIVLIQNPEAEECLIYNPCYKRITVQKIR